MCDLQVREAKDGEILIALAVSYKFEGRQEVKNITHMLEPDEVADLREIAFLGLSRVHDHVETCELCKAP